MKSGRWFRKETISRCRLIMPNSFSLPFPPLVYFVIVTLAWQSQLLEWAVSDRKSQMNCTTTLGFSLTIMWSSCWEKHLLENDHWIPFHQGDYYPMASVALWDTLETSKCLLWMSLLVGKNILFFKMLLMVYSNGNQDRTFFSSESKPAY